MLAQRMAGSGGRKRVPLLRGRLLGRRCLSAGSQPLGAPSREVLLDSGVPELRTKEKDAIKHLNNRFANLIEKVRSPNNAPRAPYSLGNASRAVSIVIHQVPSTCINIHKFMRAEDSANER